MALLALLTVALTATGFAHRMPAVTDQAQAEAVAFLLANGGGIADICGNGFPGSETKTPSCLACQIAGTADLPALAQGLIDADLAFIARVVAPRESRALLRVLDVANTPQGPPVA